MLVLTRQESLHTIALADLYFSTFLDPDQARDVSCQHDCRVLFAFDQPGGTLHILLMRRSRLPKY